MVGRTGPKTGLTDLIRELATRPCGVRTDDPKFGGELPTNVGRRAAPLVDRGELFKVKLGHKDVVYFADKKRAAAFEQESLRNRNRMKEWQRVKPHAMTSASFPGWKDAQPVTTKDTKITSGPNFTPRFQPVDLGVYAPRIYGGNQRGRVAS